MTNKSKCCNAAITTHLEFIKAKEINGKTNYYCCSDCGKPVEDQELIEDEPIHEWFELTYAQYVALPRTILQSMPIEWQNKFVELMDELDDYCEWRRGGCYVKFRNKSGRYMPDVLADYDRGRRILKAEEINALCNSHNSMYYESGQGKSQQDYEDEMETGTVKEPCSECGKVDSTVRMRTCGFDEEINNKTTWHVVCDDCETTHILDI